jgi:two-component system, OmpR family, sensor kinase
MPIRQRIAFATAGVMILLLLGLSIGIHTAMSRNLHAEVDNRLETVYNTYRQNPARIGRLPDGRIAVDLPEINPFTSPGLFMQVLDDTGRVAEQSVSLADQTLEVPQPVLQTNTGGQGTFYETSIEGAEIRVYSAPVYVEQATAPIAYVQVAESLEPLDETLNQLRGILVFGSLLATAVVSTVAWFLAGAAMRPIARMSSTAQAIGGADDLSQRLESPATGDEVERLAATFNAMLDRLEDSFQAQRRFVADASHELRTPLTALRGNADIMRRMVATGVIDRDELIEGLDGVGGEVDRLVRLVQDLLILARADVGWLPEMHQEDLGTIAREAARIVSPLTARHDFQISVPGEPLLVSGNVDQLKQLILILLDNAFNHTPPGTIIRLDVARDEDTARLTVADNGPGIAPEHQERIFERFYRPDEARARASGGTGLGLAIARWIVKTHGGSIDVESAPGRGTSFIVTLPAVPDESAPAMRDEVQPASVSTSR